MTLPVPPGLLALAGGPAFRAGVLLVAAHPDDETIGAGAMLRRLPSVHVAHVTDGAPADRRWWGAPHVASRAEYARVRREELDRALALAGIPADRVHALGFEDQRASFDLAGLTRKVADLLAELRPGVILTHPYEGGHPDHDATAFAVRAALEIIDFAPVLLEFTSYHAAGGGLEAGRFLEGDDADVVTVGLSDEERTIKARMLAAFATQRETVAQFPVRDERFRRAPQYDVTRPPHEGTLHYERFDWGSTGAEWRARAAEALRALGLGVEEGAPC